MKTLLTICAAAILTSHGLADTKQAVKKAERGLDGVVKNGTVETRIGELTFANGYPSRESVEHLFDAMDFQRATQAYIWALPIVAMAEWQAVHEEQFGAQDRDMVVYKTTEEKLEIRIRSQRL